ncbi:hypothetical protein BDZ97DRAFT_1782608 [Flammula alnicola]|nr:hypothetical protein BDZ97DRAFT_1782608 [Flammula alnicola]
MHDGQICTNRQIRLQAMPLPTAQLRESECSPNRTFLQSGSASNLSVDTAQVFTIHTLVEMSQCSICLSTFKDPVCLPCGHLYCKECLSEHVNVPANQEMTSTCPDCRATFNITIPDLTYLPKKYHPFISHAVRRVYIDVSPQSSLQKRLKKAEKRLEMKTKGEEALLQRCEALSAALSAHRNGEAEAHEKLQELGEKLEEAEDAEEEHLDTINRLNAQIALMKMENSRLTKRSNELTSHLIKEEARMNLLQQQLTSTIEDDANDRSEIDVPEYNAPSRSSMQNKIERITRPLPRRSTAQRRVREESDSPPPTFSHTKRLRLAYEGVP